LDILCYVFQTVEFPTAIQEIIMNTTRMKISYIEMPAADRANRDLVVSVDDDTFIHVRGFGSAGLTWTVSSYTYDPMLTLREFAHSEDRDGIEAFTIEHFFGIAAVFWEPLTFTHAVMDILNNV
jgi:hypothetical protein